MPPDEAALIADLASVAFSSGADRGWWHVEDRTGTVVTVAINAPTGRSITVRADCTGYPAVPPTGQLWSTQANAPLPLEEWPSGGRASEVFSRSWSPSQAGAFYFPYDRRAVLGHDAWRTQHPGHVWSPSTTITDYVRLLRQVLGSATGPAIPPMGERAL